MQRPPVQFIMPEEARKYVTLKLMRANLANHSCQNQWLLRGKTHPIKLSRELIEKLRKIFNK